MYNPRISNFAPVGPIKRNKLGRNGVMSPLYTVFRVHDMNNTYLEQFFNSSKWHSYMHLNGDNGARSDRFSIKDELFFEMPISSPNLEEQQLIGSFLENVDKVITLHQRKYVYLFSMIFKKLVYLANSWEQRKLIELVDRVVRKNTNNQSTLPLTISAQYGLVDQITYFNNRVASRDVSNYYLVFNGEFAYNKSTSEGYPYGAVKRLDLYEKGVLSTLYIVFVPKSSKNINSDYLTVFFDTDRWHKGVSERASEGARNHGLLNISAEEFFDINISLPKDVEEQEKIGNIIKDIDNLITLHQRNECIKILKEIIFMVFNKEADFENALIKVLGEKGWEKEVIKYPTEKDLIKNWANILYENNRSIDRLNDYPLTDGEMQQVIEQINSLKTPLRLNGFINGKTITIVRDNEDDKDHFGKEVSLKIYDRREIATGSSRYQIVQQPQFPTKSKVLNDRRGDLMLLINGMPVIHIELKKSGVPVSQACRQIEKYAHEGIFTGLFSLVQIFVAMNPDESLYFANPGPDGKFNPNYYFHWADFYNEPINDWKEIADKLLSIPMAHQLIGFYTVADDSDGILKVMRSYQFFAASRISDKVATNKWENNGQRGGYIWHTTGSGKTLTSFKSAQLIATSKDADKVVFLIDRIELGTQSVKEYRNFADDNQDVQETENTEVLITKLKSIDPKDTLIVTSIQKMSNIKEDGLKTDDIEKINEKRLVFIVDECHRSTFGEMLQTVKQTFPKAIFFGFTGTPIFKENSKNDSDLTDVFGDELHRYSIADGIRDKNVLGFDPYKVLTFKDRDLREAVALGEAKASDVADALSDPKKAKVYNHFMNKVEIEMGGYTDDNGKYIRGIEDYVPNSQYRSDNHRNAVVDDIIEGWVTLSQNSKFHAIFATSSITEAIEYYRIFKSKESSLKITALFDPHIDNKEGFAFKEDGLVEIIEDYNAMYGQEYSIPTADKMKKDIAARLAHKKPYERIDKTPKEQIDLLIVVDQMLTGFDSKWVNTLYLDKMLKYENLIQAFSRTNRLFGPDKPFGTIKYYRRPHTMEKNIETAVKTFSGDKAMGLFVQKLDKNIKEMNFYFEEIKDLFASCSIDNFETIPSDKESRGKFAKLFKCFNSALESAKVQGFVWKKYEYEFKDSNGKTTRINIELDKNIYLVLALRYKELFDKSPSSGSDSAIEDPPYDIDTHLVEIDTGLIDNEYMNSRFKKYIGLLAIGTATPEEIESTLNELHKTFASLTQEQQKYAGIFLRDVQSGKVAVDSGKTLTDYINEYIEKAKDNQIHVLSEVLGLDESKLIKIMESRVTEDNLNEFGRYDDLKSTVDKVKAKAYFEAIEGIIIILPKVNTKVDILLRKFILSGGFDIDLPEN